MITNKTHFSLLKGIFFDHQHPLPMVLGTAESDAFGREFYPSTVFGPTCDSLDCVCKDFPMPLHEVGDWLYFPNMGSYTTAALTRFNGFTGALTCHYTWGNSFVENVLTDLAETEFPGLPPSRTKLTKSPATSVSTTTTTCTAAVPIPVAWDCCC